jgi:hypothetical protein
VVAGGGGGHGEASEADVKLMCPDPSNEAQSQQRSIERDVASNSGAKMGGGDGGRDLKLHEISIPSEASRRL